MNHSSWRLRHSISVCLVVLTILISACGSSDAAREGSAPANAEDLVGTWQYEVVGPDVLDLRSGLIKFVLDQGALSGAIDAVHLNLAPMRNIRYRNGEVTFTANPRPGASGGMAFSLDVGGEQMSGVAYPTENSAGVATSGRPAASTNSVEVRARKVQQLHRNGSQTVIVQPGK